MRKSMSIISYKRTDKDGNEHNAAYYNTGNMLKTVAKLCRDKGDTALADSYDALFAAWLAANHAGKTDIDAQGFGVSSNG